MGVSAVESNTATANSNPLYGDLKFAFYSSFKDELALVIHGERDAFRLFAKSLELSLETRDTIIINNGKIVIELAGKNELELKLDKFVVFLKESNFKKIIDMIHGVIKHEYPCHNYMDDIENNFEIIVSQGE